METIPPIGPAAPMPHAQQPHATPTAASAAKDFEAFFLMQAFETMFAGVSMGSLTGGGQAEKTYRSFLLDAYARDLAENGGVGIAPAVRADIEAAYAAAKGNEK